MYNKINLTLKNNMNKKGFSILIAILVILLLIIATVAGWGVWQFRQLQQKIANADLTTQLANQSGANDYSSTKNISINETSSTLKQIQDPGITWINPPEVIADQPIYNDQALNSIGEEKIHYYKIGQTETGSEILLSLFPELGMGATYRTFRFFKDQDDKISFISHSSDSDRDLLENYGTIFQDGVSFNYAKLRSVTAPDFLDYNGEVLQKNYPPYTTDSADFIYQDNGRLTKLELTEYGQIFSKDTESVDYQSVIFQQLILRLPDYSLTYYTIKPKFITDNNVPIITWQDNTKNSTVFNNNGLASGCSSSGLGTRDTIVKNVEASRFSEAGVSSDGAKIYLPKNAEDLLYQDAYKNYSIGRSEATNAEKAISYDSFVTKKPIFLYKDGLGRYILFNNADFSPLAECGKPVIYLYPERTMDISVKVGADIIVSEPAYNNGWKVNANPSGRLIINGESYDSLFWEGLGRGQYPPVEAGFVVETKNIEATLKSQLTQLGLNSKEKADFMKFWLPKMPKEKYTRLTWFSTKEMDSLAPLFVSPKPATSIRVFLDYQGLDRPIKLLGQKLQAPTRKGFTLVEWGGLLVK